MNTEPFVILRVFVSSWWIGGRLYHEDAKKSCCYRARKGRTASASRGRPRSDTRANPVHPAVTAPACGFLSLIGQPDPDGVASGRDGVSALAVDFEVLAVERPVPGGLNDALRLRIFEQDGRL